MNLTPAKKKVNLILDYSLTFKKSKTNMQVKKILQGQRPSLSFEFFPPKTQEATNDLLLNIDKLASYAPNYVSITYGAGGTTRHQTHDLVSKLHKDKNIPVVPHLTCVGHSFEELHEILSHYCTMGIQNIMVLRGDPPKKEKSFTPHPQGPRYAKDLVSYIKKNFPHLSIGVAGFPEGHPETPNFIKEMDYLKEKIDAGADYICTQLFFDNHYFFEYQERCDLMGIKVPIIAGLMPITTLSGLKRMCELAEGCKIPARLLKAVKWTNSPEQLEEVGIHWATEQLRELLYRDTAGVHLYTLNKASTIETIFKNLGLNESHQLHSKEDWAL